MCCISAACVVLDHARWLCRSPLRTFRQFGLQSSASRRRHRLRLWRRVSRPVHAN